MYARLGSIYGAVYAGELCLEKRGLYESTLHGDDLLYSIGGKQATISVALEVDMRYIHAQQLSNRQYNGVLREQKTWWVGITTEAYTLRH